MLIHSFYYLTCLQQKTICYKQQLFAGLMWISCLSWLSSNRAQSVAANRLHVNLHFSYSNYSVRLLQLDEQKSKSLRNHSQVMSNAHSLNINEANMFVWLAQTNQNGFINILIRWAANFREISKSVPWIYHVSHDAWAFSDFKGWIIRFIISIKNN